MNLKFHVWWASQRDLLFRLISLAASYASIVGITVPFLPAPREMPWWMIALFSLSLLSLLVLIVLEIKTRKGRRMYMKRDRESIRKYMHAWISHGGRVAIWTRDMSWTENAETKRLLLQKARAKELIICLPQETPFAKQLKDEGAEVCAYDGSGYDPSSRFTITEFKRVGSRVAVGHAAGEFHIIDEFNSADHPAFYLAEDLVALVHARNRGKTPEQ